MSSDPNATPLARDWGRWAADCERRARLGHRHLSAASPAAYDGSEDETTSAPAPTEPAKLATVIDFAARRTTNA